MQVSSQVFFFSKIFHIAKLKFVLGSFKMILLLKLCCILKTCTYGDIIYQHAKQVENFHLFCDEI